MCNAGKSWTEKGLITKRASKSPNGALRTLNKGCTSLLLGGKIINGSQEITQAAKGVVWPRQLTNWSASSSAPGAKRPVPARHRGKDRSTHLLHLTSREWLQAAFAWDAGKVCAG